MITIYQPKLREDLRQIKQLHLILAIFGVRYICPSRECSVTTFHSKVRTKPSLRWIPDFCLKILILNLVNLLFSVPKLIDNHKVPII